MAIIDCPQCHQKISNKAKQCSHCHLDLTNLDEQKLRHLQQISTIEQSQKLMTWSFIAMLLFCGGFLALYTVEMAKDSWQFATAVSASAGGFVLYIVMRIKIILLKRRLKG